METPVLMVPHWLEYTVTGVLVVLALWLLQRFLLVIVDQFKATKKVDDRVIAQLVERDSYIKKLEGQVELYFNRNISLTDKIIALSQEYLAKATDFGKGMDRAFTEIKLLRDEVATCTEQHKECTSELAAQRAEFKTQLAALTAQVAVVAVNAAPAERHTVIGGN